MKIKRYYIFLILWIITMNMFLNIVNANEIVSEKSMKLEASHTKLEKGEEVIITMKISDERIASGTWTIYFDHTKLNYEKGPENANVVGSLLLYTWVTKDR